MAEGMAWKVGNGRCISIFFDRWVGVHNAHKLTVAWNEDHELNMVDDLIYENLGIWRTKLVENNFREELQRRFLLCRSVLEGRKI